MRKILLTILLSLIACVALCQQKATVQPYNGLYIFIDCLPVTPYDSIGVVEMGTSYSTPEGNTIVFATPSICKQLVADAKKKYPQADGMIFKDAFLTKATVIKIK